MFEQACNTSGGMDFQTLFDSFSQCFGSTQTAYPPSSDRDLTRRSRAQTSPPRSSSKHQTHHNEPPTTANRNKQDVRKERYSKRMSRQDHRETPLNHGAQKMITPPRPPPLSNKQERDGPERQRSTSSSGLLRPKTDSPMESASRTHAVPRTPKTPTRPTGKNCDSTRKKYVPPEGPHYAAEVKNADDTTPSRVCRSSESTSRTKSTRSTSKPMAKDDIFRLKDRSKSTGTPFSQTKDVMKNALCFASPGQAPGQVGSTKECMQAEVETNTGDQTPHASVANAVEDFDRVPTTDTAEVSLPASMFFERTASQLKNEELMPLYNQFSVPVENSEQDGLNDVIATRSEPRAFDGNKPEQNYCKQMFVAGGGHDYFQDEKKRFGDTKSKGLTPQRKRTESTMSLSNASGMSSSTPNSAGGISFVPHSKD